MSTKYYVKVGSQFCHKNDAAGISKTGKRFVLKEARYAFFSEIAAQEAKRIYNGEIIKEGEDSGDKYYVLPDVNSAIGELKPSRIERRIENNIGE